MVRYRQVLCRAAVLLGLTSSVAATVAAQSVAADPLQPVCPPGKSPKVDTTDVIVGLEPAKEFLDSAYTAAEYQRIAFYAEGIARHFVAPATLGAIPTLVDLPAYYQDGVDNGGRSVLTGRLILITRKDGRIKSLAWEHIPIALPLAAAVVRAAQMADSAGDFDGIVRPDTVTHGDTLAIEIRSRREVEAPQFPLMRARLPGYRGETLAMVIRAATVEYPRTAARQRVGTEGEVRFVVGTDGRAIESLLQVTRAGWRDFVLPMRKAILNTIYEPATSGGCRVPTLARQRFNFKATR